MFKEQTLNEIIQTPAKHQPKTCSWHTADSTEVINNINYY